MKSMFFLVFSLVGSLSQAQNRPNIDGSSGWGGVKVPESCHAYYSAQAYSPLSGTDGVGSCACSTRKASQLALENCGSADCRIVNVGSADQALSIAVDQQNPGRFSVAASNNKTRSEYLENAPENSGASRRAWASLDPYSNKNARMINARNAALKKCGLGKCVSISSAWPCR